MNFRIVICGGTFIVVPEFAVAVLLVRGPLRFFERRRARLNGAQAATDLIQERSYSFSILSLSAGRVRVRARAGVAGIWRGLDQSLGIDDAINASGGARGDPLDFAGFDNVVFFQFGEWGCARLRDAAPWLMGISGLSGDLVIIGMDFVLAANDKISISEAVLVDGAVRRARVNGWAAPGRGVDELVIGVVPGRPFLGVPLLEARDGGVQCPPNNKGRFFSG